MPSRQEPEEELLEGLQQQTRRSRRGGDERIPPLGGPLDTLVEEGEESPEDVLDLEPSEAASRRGAHAAGDGGRRDVAGDLLRGARAMKPQHRVLAAAAAIALILLVVAIASSSGGDDPQPQKRTAQTSPGTVAQRPARAQDGAKVDPATGLPEDLQPRGIEVFADQRLAGAGNGKPVPDRLVMFLPAMGTDRESGVVVSKIRHRTSAKVRAGGEIDVEGQAVRGATPAVRSLVTIVAKERGQTAQIVARSRTDALGHFRLAVPVGTRKTQLVAYLFADRNARTAIMSDRLDVSVSAPSRKARP